MRRLVERRLGVGGVRLGPPRQRAGSLGGPSGSAAYGSVLSGSAGSGSLSGPASGSASGSGASQGSLSGVSGASGSAASQSGASGMSGDFIDGCDVCPNGAARQFSLPLSGVANGTCSDCNNLNQTFTLDYAGGCSWSASLDFICIGHTVEFSMTVVSSSEVTLTILDAASGQDAFYQASSLGWDCKSPLTLTLTSNSFTECTNLPAHITIYPV